MSSPADIIVVTNRKGSTGKTTTSVNLAAEFAAIGKRILLIDMDMDTQGHCAIGLGEKSAEKSRDSLFTSRSLLKWPMLCVGKRIVFYEEGFDGSVSKLFNIKELMYEMQRVTRTSLSAAAPDEVKDCA